MKTRKLYIFMLAVAAVLTACTNEDNFINELLPNAGNEARTYTVNIPASMGEGATNRAVTFNNDATPPTATGRFDASEPVYVYNETKGVMLSGVLHPSNISDDGKLCNLEGTLTGSFNASDQLTLIYNMNRFYTNPADCDFRYDYQDGSGSDVVDGGMATGVSATISGSTLTTTTTVTFAMQQAIFRLKFTDGTNTITVNSLTIECTGSDVVGYYSPFKEDNKYQGQTIRVNPTTATSDYLYVALGINESAEPSALTFTVIDDDGDVYTATKAAPSSGFKNGKYYYSSAATVLTKQTLVKPTITWTSVADFTKKEPKSDNWYYVTGPEIGDRVWGPSEFTISGISRGYRFIAYNGANIHLDNLDAIYVYSDLDFIHSTNDQCELILDISGANTITCKTADQAISSEGTLKLKGNGTLTVTVKAYNLCGLYANTNYKSDNNSDASVLAAPGYAVTRSDMTDNQDGTYTWTYTVMPAINGKFSVSSTKQVYFSKGNLRYASGKWSFFDNQYDYYTSYSADAWDKFGWSTSANNYGMSTSQTSSDYSDEFKDWGATMGTGWRTLTSDEWTYLFNTRSASTVGSTANGRYAKGKVNDVQGIILFPDTYTHPDGVTAPIGVNAEGDAGWNGNTYTVADWTKMESAGCVFLPAAGYRNGSSVYEAGTLGIYRSATPNGSESAYYVEFLSSGLNPAANTYVRGLGFSVRLVHDAN